MMLWECSVPVVGLACGLTELDCFCVDVSTYVKVSVLQISRLTSDMVFGWPTELNVPLVSCHNCISACWDFHLCWAFVCVTSYSYSWIYWICRLWLDVSTSVSCSPCWVSFMGRPIWWLDPVSIHNLPGVQLEVGNVMIKGLQAATAYFVNMSCGAMLLFIPELKSAWKNLDDLFLHVSWQRFCLEGDLQRMESKLCLCQDPSQMMFQALGLLRSFGRRFHCCLNVLWNLVRTVH